MSGLKLENVGPTFSSLTVLLGEKSLHVPILVSEFIPFCCLKAILLILEFTFIKLS